MKTYNIPEVDSTMTTLMYIKNSSLFDKRIIDAFDVAIDIINEHKIRLIRSSSRNGTTIRRENLEDDIAMPNISWEFCPNCKGRGWVPNRYNKPSLCLTCAGECAIKRCPTCNVIIPASDNKCFMCLLKSAPNLTEDPDVKDWS